MIRDLNPDYHQAARDLFYFEFDDGFAKSFDSHAANIDKIYSNFEKHAEEMILQYARIIPSRWEQSFSSFLEIISGHDISWRLAGSTALAVRGIEVLPRDIDLFVDAEDCIKLGNLLLEYMIEPVQYIEGWIADWFGRSFINTRLEWAGGLHDSTCETDIIDWNGFEIRVPSLELLLQESIYRGLQDRVDSINKFSGKTQKGN